MHVIPSGVIALLVGISLAAVVIALCALHQSTQRATTRAAGSAWLKLSHGTHAESAGSTSTGYGLSRGEGSPVRPSRFPTLGESPYDTYEPFGGKGPATDGGSRGGDSALL